MGDLNLLNRLIDKITYENIKLPPEATRTLLTVFSRRHIKINDALSTFQKFKGLNFPLNTSHYLELEFDAKSYNVILKSLLRSNNMESLTYLLHMMTQDKVYIAYSIGILSVRVFYYQIVQVYHNILLQVL